jgi:fluoride ion exporter CrcB/FEX
MPLHSGQIAGYNLVVIELPGEAHMALQVLSVIGALMVLMAYGLIQGGVWRELDAGYLALNIIGSLILGVVAIADQRVGFILLEFAWAGIGVIGVVRALKARKTGHAVSSLI